MKRMEVALMAGNKKNKVKFNIKNIHIAKRIVADGAPTTYDTPFAMPGGVSISLEPQGEINKFYADGIVYYQSSSNAGYEGDLEVAKVIDQFRTEILKEILDDNSVLFEDVNAVSEPFALGFDIDGDQRTERFWFFNCVATRSTEESSTIEDTTEPTTETITISAAPDENGYVRARTTADTPDNIYTDWYKSVYTKADTQEDGE